MADSRRADKRAERSQLGSQSPKVPDNRDSLSSSSSRKLRRRARKDREKADREHGPTSCNRPTPAGDRAELVTETAGNVADLSRVLEVLEELGLSPSDILVDALGRVWLSMTFLEHVLAHASPDQRAILEAVRRELLTSTGTGDPLRPSRSLLPQLVLRGPA